MRLFRPNQIDKWIRGPEIGPHHQMPFWAYPKWGIWPPLPAWGMEAARKRERGFDVTSIFQSGPIRPDCPNLFPYRRELK